MTTSHEEQEKCTKKLVNDKEYIKSVNYLFQLARISRGTGNVVVFLGGLKCYSVFSCEDCLLRLMDEVSPDKRED